MYENWFFLPYWHKVIGTPCYKRPSITKLRQMQKLTYPSRNTIFRDSELLANKKRISSTPEHLLIDNSFNSSTCQQSNLAIPLRSKSPSSRFSTVFGTRWGRGKAASQMLNRLRLFSLVRCGRNLAIRRSRSMHSRLKDFRVDLAFRTSWVGSATLTSILSRAVNWK